jgi:heterodisulfide reductase subunit A2
MDSERTPRTGVSDPGSAGPSPRPSPRGRGGSPLPAVRIGVYVCHCGGNISDVVDVKQVAERAGRLPGVVVSRTHTFMCSDPGQEAIVEDIKSQQLDRVVVASCSPRLHELTFRNALQRAGLNPYLYEHANIREQVSWVTHDHRAATDKASLLVAAAVGKARHLEPLDPIQVDARAHALVIGGGVSGLKAASDLSARGIGVTLVERSPFLGGHMSQLDRVYPTGEEAHTLLTPLMDAVLRDPNILTLTNAEVVSATGYIGNFTAQVRQLPRGVAGGGIDLKSAEAVCPVDVPDEHDYGLTTRKAIYRPYAESRPAAAAIDWEACTRCGKCAETAGREIDLSAEGTTFTVNAGVIVMATGFDHYEPAIGEYGYGELPEVLTLPQLIREMGRQRGEKSQLTWNGRRIRRVAMVHCVGSRQIEGIHEPKEGEPLHEYCSRTCCTATLQAANELKDAFPGIEVFDLYRDIRTYGRGHEEYYENAGRKGVLFFRYAPEESPTVVRADGGSRYPVMVRVKDKLSWDEEIELPVDLVVLAVGMVPRPGRELVEMLKLPTGSDGFLQEVHPKLRPVEVATNGILLAGTAQGPKDITESAAAASAAAVKAAIALSRGFVQLDPFVAVVDPAKCDGCGKCVGACGYEGTIGFSEGVAPEGMKAEINGALCKGCGACVAACPRKAIELKGWTLEQFESMVDALVSDEVLAVEVAR